MLVLISKCSKKEENRRGRRILSKTKIRISMVVERKRKEQFLGSGILSKQASDLKTLPAEHARTPGTNF